jgi:hypothetical protein
MVNPTLFTAITPTQSGAALTYTAASASSTGDLVPVALFGMTVVLIKNSDAGSTHTVTFASQADQWGNVVSKTDTVGESGTLAVQLSPPARWCNTAAGNTCAVTYDAYADLSIAVLNVPWQSI